MLTITLKNGKSKITSLSAARLRRSPCQEAKMAEEEDSHSSCSLIRAPWSAESTKVVWNSREEKSCAEALVLNVNRGKEETSEMECCPIIL